MRQANNPSGSMCHLAVRLDAALRRAGVPSYFVTVHCARGEGEYEQ